MSDPLRSYQGAHVLVMGASGFIGRWVAKELTGAGARVTSAVRHPQSFKTVAKQWAITGDVVEVDALDLDDVRQMLESARADIVFNLVGYGVDRSETDVGVMDRLNCDLVRHIAEVLRGLPASPKWVGRRLVHAGSALEYGLVSGMVREDMMPMPHTDYGRTKLAGSVALSDAASPDVDAVTARAFTVFGPGEHRGRLLPTIREAAAAGTTVRLSAGTQRRDFAYVEDVAQGLLRLGLSSGTSGEVVNVATGRLTSVREFAEAAARVAGLDLQRLEFGAEPIRSDEMEISGVDVERFRQATGWNLPADLDALLRRAAVFESGLRGQTPRL